MMDQKTLGGLAEFTHYAVRILLLRLVPNCRSCKRLPLLDDVHKLVDKDEEDGEESERVGECGQGGVAVKTQCENRI